jgi:heme-degrading monooxygenase HmoA
MHTIVWRYRVEPRARAAFEEHYRADGAWARLFRQAPGYQGTDLFRDASDGDVYLTLDHWTDAGAFHAFEASHADAYAGLDRRCEGLTLQEERLGAMST